MRKIEHESPSHTPVAYRNNPIIYHSLKIGALLQNPPTLSLYDTVVFVTLKRLHFAVLLSICGPDLIRAYDTSCTADLSNGPIASICAFTVPQCSGKNGNISTQPMSKAASAQFLPCAQKLCFLRIRARRALISI